MNIQTHIRPELWQAISSTYQSGNYSHAILDAMHLLSDVLRDKTGLDGDGTVLVGQALGGESPRLRLTKLQTETERSIQKGVEQTLRGLYLAVRNPRSHEQIEDSKETADAIIHFIDYLLSLIAQSEEPFTIEGFISRAFDPDFVESQRYAELLVTEIPPNKRLDILIELYRRRTEGEGKKLKYLFGTLLDIVSEDQLSQFLSVVSEDLKISTSETAIRLTMQVLPTHLWPNLSEVSRLRIENKLIQSVSSGTMDANYHRAKTGALGTWARDFAKHFTLRDEFAYTLVNKIVDGNSYERCYIANFFFSILPEVVTSGGLRRRCINAISDAIRQGDEHVESALVSWFHSLPDDWQQEFVQNLSDLTDPDNPRLYLADGTPFLRGGLLEDEIPF